MSVKGFSFDGGATVEKYDYTELDNKPSIPVVDGTLDVSGAAADAKKVGDEIADLKTNLDNTESSVESILDALPKESLSGQMVTFEAEKITAINLFVDMPVAQSGSGDPGYDNPRSITAYNGITIYQSGADVSTPNEIVSKDWSSDIGNSGGSFDVVSGIFSEEWAYKKITSLNEMSVFQSGTNDAGTWCTFTHAVSSKKSGIATTDRPDGNGYFNLGDWRKGTVSGRNRAYLYTVTQIRIVVVSADYDLTTAEGRTNYFANVVSQYGGFELAYRLKTPINHDIGGTAVKSLAGINNIWASGGVTNVVFLSEINLDELDDKINVNSEFISDLGILNWYPKKTILEQVDGATDLTCIGIQSDGHTFTINGDNTKTSADAYIRIVISKNVVRCSSYSNLQKQGLANLFPLKNGHQYRLKFDYISGSKIGNCLVIIRNANHTDIGNVSEENPIRDIIWTSDEGGYIYIYSTTGEEFTDYKFKITLTDTTQLLFRFSEENCYKIATSFTRETIFEAARAEKGNAQGICTDGTYIYTAQIPYNESWLNIIKLDANGSVIAENRISSTGHANQLAYDPISNRILAVGSNTDAYVYRIDPDTLEIIDHLELENVKNAMIAKQGTWGFWAIAYDTEKDVFIIGSTNCYAITNNDFSVIYRVVKQNITGSGQGLYPFGDVIYGIYGGGDNDCITYNWDGQQIYAYNVGRGVAELEGICVLNGVLFSYWNAGSNLRVAKDAINYYRYIPVEKVVKQFKF